MIELLHKGVRSRWVRLKSSRGFVNRLSGAPVLRKREFYMNGRPLTNK